MENNKMHFDEINEALLDFLDRSPNAFFAVRNMAEMLEEAGFSGLEERDHWKLEAGGAYYVTRNGSALIAFRIPEGGFTGFQIMASHCDSPVLKIKPDAEITVEGRYRKLNVEKYGGMICAPWLDRPLSVAGRVVVQTPEGIETKLVNVDRDLLIIPNLAIHMNREVNDGYKFNAQVDLLPLLGETAGTQEADRFQNLIAAEAGVRPDRILDTDLYLYDRMKGTCLGADREFIASGRLDDLQCAFSSLRGILAAKPSRSIAVHCVYDNEEVGSSTRQGAGGSFLRDVLHRINTALGRSEEDYLRSLASSFMVSADNAHSVHPNHPAKADPTNRPYMNSGIVIKYNASQRYTTDAVSGSVFREICRKAGVPWQTFANRSDMLSGSTLGNISMSQVAVRTVDVGLAQLAMHSPYETAGARDTAYLVEAARVLFSSSVEDEGGGRIRL
ncbi:MAG: M18 family aminopeptidase, partial [Eubacteriales bacterium]|nr:M18 family aminopeptidase [Eubacteriales bacterium]